MSEVDTSSDYGYARSARIAGEEADAAGFQAAALEVIGKLSPGHPLLMRIRATIDKDPDTPTPETPVDVLNKCGELALNNREIQAGKLASQDRCLEIAAQNYTGMEADVNAAG